MSLSPLETREAIRKEFKFLAEAHGYAEAQPSQSAIETYSEVQYFKHKWMISIQITAHGTRITPRLVSPSGQVGFLSFLFDPKTARSLRAKYPPDIEGEILYAAQCLRTYGSALLAGDCADFESVLTLVQDRHRSWLIKSRIVSEADLARFGQCQE